MSQAIELTMEQEFNLRNFEVIVQKMSHEQVREFLVEQQKMMMIQDKLYQELLKHEWKMD